MGFPVNFPDLIITSIETMDFFDVVTGSYMFTLDELQSATIANSEDSTDVTGKNGRVLNTLKRNKTVTISGTNGILSGGLLAAQTGGEFTTKNTKVRWTDYLVVEKESNTYTATTTYKAVGTEGAEIKKVYLKNGDGTLGTAFTQDSSTSAGKFTYNPSTKVLTFYAGAAASGGDPAIDPDIPDGTEIAVFYDRLISADTLDNNSETYSSKAAVYINAIAEDKCANMYRVQFFMPKASFNGTFSIELGGTQVVHAFELRSLAGGACGNTTSGNMWTWTVFTEDAADVVESENDNG